MVTCMYLLALFMKLSRYPTMLYLAELQKNIKVCVCMCVHYSGLKEGIEIYQFVHFYFFTLSFTLTRGHFFNAFRERKGERKGEKETWMQERSSHQLPPTHTQTRNQTCTLQPRYVP